MLIADFFSKINLDKTLLIGYYGGGNFGDELLLEVILNKLKENNRKDIDIRYVNSNEYRVFHHDFGYNVVSGENIISVLRSLLTRKHIIVGGGGFWGLDANRSVLLMCILLCISRFILFKKVHIIGVGYYSSTPKIGHVSAFLAAISANTLIVRDKESYHNFRRYKSNVFIDQDIAFQIDKKMIDGYKNDIVKLERLIKIKDKTTYVSFRKFRGEMDKYNQLLFDYIKSDTTSNYLVGILQPSKEYPDGIKKVNILSSQSNVKKMPEQVNPMALVGFMEKYSNKINIISPQFHIILTAILINIEYMPLIYDNKVYELLKTHNIYDAISLNELSINQLNEFIK